MASGGGALEKIIKTAVGRGASDLHIKAGDVFRARINGALVPLTKQRLTPEQTRAIALKLLPSDEDRDRIDAIRDYDCSWGMAGVGRFRVNILRQRSSFMVVLRVVPFAVPSLESLGLPESLAKVAEMERGLVLVTGTSGSGKSSTIAALVHHINSRSGAHIITIEDPIEFLHRDLNSSVSQREVGIDTESIAQGLRAALRQDPDVLMVSDLRDAPTIDSAIKAAEEGHLVIAGLSSPDIPSALERVVSMLPAESREMGRMRLSEALSAVVHQRLLPRADLSGRIAVVELMIATSQIREVVRQPTRLGQLKALIGQGRDAHGMQTMEQHVKEMVAAGVVNAETAKASMARPSAS